MQRREILCRWLALDEGDGLARCRRLSRILSVSAFVLLLLTVLGIRNESVPRWALAALAVPIGYLFAERNALDSRAASWPDFREYLDWNKIRQDLKSDERA